MSSNPLAKQSVDIAEQEALMATFLETLVKEAGGMPRYFYTTPEEARTYITEFPPSLIVLDISMYEPGDGLEVLADVIRSTANTSSLVITRETDRSVLTQCDQKGAGSILHKQCCKQNDIIKSIHELLFSGSGKPKIPVTEAIRVLELNKDKVATVNEWADIMGFSSRYFIRKFKNRFNVSPKKYLVDFRKKRIKYLLSVNPKLSNHKLAQKMGLSNDNSLYQFVKHHFGTTTTELRNDIEKKDKV